MSRWLVLLPVASLLAACAGGAQKYDRQQNVCLVAHVSTEVIIKEKRDSTEKAPDPQLDAAFHRACKAAHAK